MGSNVILGILMRSYYNLIEVVCRFEAIVKCLLMALSPDTPNLQVKRLKTFSAEGVLESEWKLGL